MLADRIVFRYLGVKSKFIIRNWRHARIHLMKSLVTTRMYYFPSLYRWKNKKSYAYRDFYALDDLKRRSGGKRVKFPMVGSSHHVPNRLNGRKNKYRVPRGFNWASNRNSVAKYFESIENSRKTRGSLFMLNIGDIHIATSFKHGNKWYLIDQYGVYSTSDTKELEKHIYAQIKKLLWLGASSMLGISVYNRRIALEREQLLKNAAKWVNSALKRDNNRSDKE